jgi:hypothetical protein
MEALAVAAKTKPAEAGSMLSQRRYHDTSYINV